MDAARIRRWLGSDEDLIADLEMRRKWSIDSELGPSY